MVCGVLVVAFAAIGFSSVVPPAALPLDAPESSFSAARAAEHIAVIARNPHPMGSVAIADVREYVIAELEELGLDAALQTVAVPSYYDSRASVDVVNVVATIPGTASTGTIALMAHYDTEPPTTGANDNSAAVAALLEAGRALLAGPRLRNDVILLFTDGEEPAPRYGSQAFLAENPAAANVALVMNLEAAGNSGPSMLIETSGPESWMVAQFAAAVSSPTAFSFVAETVAVIGDIGTDFDPFRNAGVPGFHVVYMRGSPIYHTPADDLDSVSWDSVQHHGSNAMGVARRFGELDLDAVPDSGGSVYFTLRPFFVQYSAWLSRAVALLAAVMLVRVLLRSARHHPPSMRSAARVGARAVLFTLAVLLTETLAWILITKVRSTPSVAESYVYLLFLVGLGAVAVFELTRRQSPHPGAGRLGFSLTWVALGLLTSLGAPGLSYLFVWPALAGAVTMNWNPPAQRTLAVVRFALVAGPTVVLLTPAIDFFFQFGQPRPGNLDSSIPAVAAVGFLLAFLACGLIRDVWTADGGTDTDRSRVPIRMKFQ